MTITPLCMVMSRPGRSADATVRQSRHGGHVDRLPKKYQRLPRNLVRGQGYFTSHGLGYYVGTTPLGRHWFCYGRLAELREMCERFDLRFGKRAPAHK